MKFYNRSNELQFFDKLRLQKGKRFIVIYGRRRIGKTTLIKRAFEGLGAFYYYVEVMKEETLLRELSFTFLKAFYTDWFNLFSAIFERYEYVIFDEFQNFYKVSPNIMYALQHAWDENTHDTKLIVLGSYVGLMKNIFIDEKMPLFGRSDNVIKIKEFTLKDSIAMLQDFGYTMQEAIQIYAIVGGIPRYLWLFECKAPLSELIYDIFIDDFAPLKEEARNILITEFGSEHKSYFSILQALSGSSKSLAEIAEQTGIEKTKLSKYLIELSDIYEIVSRESSVYSSTSKNYKYAIRDYYYNFFFKFIYKDYSLVEFDPKQAIELFMGKLNNFFGLQFERICNRFIEENPQTLGFIPKEVGKHWGKVPYKKGESYDIDIIAYNDQNIAFGECKWTNKKVSIGDYEKLLLRSNYIDIYGKRKIYVLFSKSGFEEDLLKIKSDTLILLTLEDMAKIMGL